jgi:hypothetical protein
MIGLPLSFRLRADLSRRTPSSVGLPALALLALLAGSCEATSHVDPTVQGSLAPPPLIPLKPAEDFALVPSSPSHDFSRPNWIDADEDCQTTRVEVLTAEAVGPVEFEDEHRCKVTRGRWRCPYTGEWIEDPKELDIDHVVPLKNAWDSGASAWTGERWRQFANDLERGEHLLAVSASANRSKGARGPDEWLPPLAESRCQYVRDWAAIKARWELRASEAEAAATERALALCEAGQIPPLPQKTTAEIQPPISEPAPESLVQTCCKVCRKGKACGDTCIARDKTCSVEPGCACDGSDAAAREEPQAW